jgi:hypothetical protein
MKDSEFIVVACDHCGQKNRVRLRPNPVCGRCKSSLAPTIDRLALAEIRRKYENLSEARDRVEEKLN